MSQGSIRNFVLGDPQAARVVPPSGHTAYLTMFVSLAMAFLAVFALALSMASDRLADRWASELAQSATLRINAPADQIAAQTALALDILDQTPGVGSARALDQAEQSALLEPWFGTGLSLEALPVPQLIEVISVGAGYDVAGLRLRLQAEVPGAVLDDHGRWRRPLVQAAAALERLGKISILLIGGALAAMVTLAANASLAANRQVIEVLRLVGAQDRFIARAFVRRFTLRALIGATSGVALGLAGILLMPAASDAGGFLTGLGFQGTGWLVPLVIPPMAAIVAWLATNLAARRTLKELN